MGWRGCENVAWAVTRVHAGKLFLFICSMLPWRIDISHEFTWEKERKRGKRERKRERRKEEGHPSVAGDGERFPFPLLARTMATFLVYPVFPLPSSQETKRWYEERILQRWKLACSFDVAPCKDLLENCYYYFFIIVGIFEFSRWKYGSISIFVQILFLSIHFSLEK